MSGVRSDSLSRDALRDAAVGGVRWVALARLASELLALVTSVVLARLIAPAEFGHAAVALVIPILGVIFGFQGFGSVLVQREHLDWGEVQTAMFCSIAFGLAATAILWGTTPLWGESLFGARTSELIRLASPAFAIAGFGVVSRALLQRELAFSRMSTTEVVGFSIGSAVSLIAAAGGLGAEALIIGGLVGIAADTGLMCVIAPPPLPRLEVGRVRGIVSFGFAASLASLSWVARRNIDYVVLAARLPAASVGFYWRGFTLGAAYADKLGGVTARLAFPLFSRSADLDDTRLLRSRVVRTNVAVIFPLLATFIVVAPILIPWLYGARWEPAIVPAQILTVGGMSLAVMSGTEQLILAMGHPRILLTFNSSFLVAVALAVLIASSYGLVAVCVSVVAVHIVMVAVAQVGLLRRLVMIRMRQLAADVVPALAASCVAVLAGMVADLSVGGSASDLVKLVALGTVCSGAYLMVFRVFFASAWSETVRTLRRVVLPRRIEAPSSPPPIQESAA